METYSGYELRKAKEGDGLVTVVVTCRDLEKYIGRCLDSVCGQTYRDLEILVVDDGSKDGSVRICEKRAAEDPRVRVLHTDGGGPGTARNAAIREARGEYIGFVDGDDFIEPQMFEIMVTCLADTGSDLAVCAYRSLSQEDPASRRGMKPALAAMRFMGPGPAIPRVGTTDLTVMDRDELLTLYVQEDEKIPVRNAVWNKLCRRTLIGEQRMPDRMCYEDILFTVKLLSAVQKACFIDTPLYNYIIDRKDSIMNRGVNSAILTEQLPAYEAKNRFLVSIGRTDLMYTHRYLEYKKLLVLCTEARRSGDPEKRAALPGLVAALRTAKDGFDRIYACPIADPHQKLRMRLFLWNPVLFYLFTDLNDGIVMPLRRALAGRKAADGEKP
ncbi:MAG: glycosyltransferase [Lachnospiraceae bacterium]|nr:glycosyltransferase [Lachnospiraceae bacterium]